ncbi:MAG: glycosyltransferase [Solirubrobacteraceae bacterium]
MPRLFPGVWRVALVLGAVLAAVIVWQAAIVEREYFTGTNSVVDRSVIVTTDAGEELCLDELYVPEGTGRLRSLVPWRRRAAVRRDVSDDRRLRHEHHARDLVPASTRVRAHVRRVASRRGRSRGRAVSAAPGRRVDVRGDPGAPAAAQLRRGAAARRNGRLPPHTGAGDARRRGDRLRPVLAGHVADADLVALYRATLCFVFPSRYEGFGLPVLEAMASGPPSCAAIARACRRWRETPPCSYHRTTRRPWSAPSVT